jgi:uncharacterized protein (TIGR03437 family)
MRALGVLFTAVLAVAPMDGASTVAITVLNRMDTGSGQNGRLNVFLSTSFQPADWDYTFFQDHPGNEKLLWELAPQHINLQSIAGGNPATGANSWDFTENNAVNQPILALADHSPLYEIVPPPYLTQSDGSVVPGDFPTFAGYTANLVRYFNAGGFRAAGNAYLNMQSPTPYHITWWGIYNEPNVNGMTPQAYTQLYNVTVPAMQAVDPNVRFVAVELADWTGQADAFLPYFVQNVSARVDLVATHFYGTCDQSTPDVQVFGAIDTFASEVQRIRADIQANSALANLPIWITENNVNADYGDSNGMSVCNPGQKFVTDQRGSSAFFAAWRPLVFARLAKVGASSLHHWDHDADLQYGEVDFSTGNLQLSYWVDYWLSHLFPSPPGADILQVQNADTTGSVDAFAVRNDDGSVVIMLIDHALRLAADNNGPGDAFTFNVNVSALGSFDSVTTLTIDTLTSAAAGPSLQTVPFMPNLSVTLPGYGVAFLRLNAAPVTILPGGIVNGASFQSGPLSPGEIVTIFGHGMGPSTLQTMQSTAAPGFLDNSLAGTRVWFDGTPAPVVYSYKDYVSAIVPYAVAGQGSTNVQVEYLGVFSPTVNMPVAATAPAIFTEPPEGTGGGAILDQNYALVTPANPASPGDWVTIFATGEGNADPDALDGRIAEGLASSNVPVTVTIGGLPATVKYAGRVPGNVFGVLQVEAQIPTGVAARANVPVQIQIGNATSQSGVTVAVK